LRHFFKIRGKKWLGIDFDEEKEFIKIRNKDKGGWGGERN